MPHIWIETEDGWGIVPLTGDTYRLTGFPDRPVGRATRARQGGEGEEGTEPCGVKLLREPARGPNSEDTWLLLADPSSALRVNGLPLPLGARVLRDRDELDLDGLAPVFFSGESLARVEPLPETGRDVHCPRCRQLLVPGTEAVRCPSCKVWHHQSSEFGCWDYAERCALCPQLTDLEAGFRWTPQEL